MSSTGESSSVQLETPPYGDFVNEPVPSSLVEIIPILRVANEVESINPRVAYLCRFYAFEKAHRLDPNAMGRGVRQFRTSLLQQLERQVSATTSLASAMKDSIYPIRRSTLRVKLPNGECAHMGACVWNNDLTLKARTTQNDAREMKNFYQHYYSKYMQALQTEGDRDYRVQITRTYQTASVLFEVLKAVTSEIDSEILEIHDKVNERTETSARYNILPLDPVFANQTIMEYPEVQRAVRALQYTRNLPWPENWKTKNSEDIVDWLQAWFGFQKDNVSNQREHLILLLANMHVRLCTNPDQLSELDDRTINEVMKKLLENYKKWCKYLGRKSSLWLPILQKEVQQRKLLYVGLYLLIWGEAANLRLMPECLCYIFHHMAFEVYAMLSGQIISPMTGERVRPVYGGDEEAFLRKVVTPIYEVVAWEAVRSKKGKSKHSQWRSYDDLNEYFWSADCFYIGWPMRNDADFFSKPVDQSRTYKNGDIIPARNQWVGKVNFVEIRSYGHVFRSFGRMWTFLILCLQAMIIIAWDGSGQPTSIFEAMVFKKVLSISLTAAILNFGQAILDFILNWKTRRNIVFHVKLRHILKIVSASAWVIIFPLTYAYAWEHPPGFSQTIKRRLGNGSSSPSLFISAIAIYLFPNMLSAVLFLCPSIRRFLETTNKKFVMLIMWWSQSRLYVGRAMPGSKFSLLKYTLFWVFLIVTKLAFSFYIEIRPLIGPTRSIMSTRIRTHSPHELFLQAENNTGVVIALWAPVILVYFVDTQIWYTVFFTLFGGVYGAFCRLGEIQTLEMLRCRFQSLPAAFNAHLIPRETSESTKNKGLRVTFSRILCQNLSSTENEAAKFAQLWNTIITSFREEDLISNREMDLLIVPYCADLKLELMQWPLFLLVSKIQIAVEMASNGKGRELMRQLASDHYMYSAVRECYAIFCSLVSFIVCGDHEKQIIRCLLQKVDKHIEEGILLNEYNLSALPALYDLFVRLVKYLLDNKQEDQNVVLVLFQDMLEVVTRDIMEDVSDLFDSIHSARGPEGNTQPQYQLLTSAGSISFPVPESEAWKEKIKRLYMLLTVKESATDIPTNLEARRRITFFSNSLFMDMPSAPKARDMLAFSVLTPYRTEKVLFSLPELEVPNEDGVPILLYLQKNFPDEWNNFLERVKGHNLELRGSIEFEEQIRLWASYRGQTLARTIRGMMYYRKALELQAFLDMAKCDDLMKGYKAIEVNDGHMKGERSLSSQCQVVAEMKFTYVVSCQLYWFHKKTGDPRARDISRLMTMNPSLRVVYIDEVENLSNGVKHKVYYSTLVKANSAEPLQNLDQVIYRIKLPGPPILGEPKSENQNHAIIFTRGEALQTVDVNQDNYIEEAFKMRNLLEEFHKKQDLRCPTVLGLREHVFTGSVSSLSRLMSNQEASVGTIGQRVLANPLKVRFHCGNSDVFDRLFHLTRGGVTKASMSINQSEEIFAGFNSTLREGNITHHEYIQVGKGADVGLNQISLSEARTAIGNGEQTISRDLYRLGHRFDFFRMLSCYFSTIGFDVTALITVLNVYVFLYSRIYLVLSGAQRELATQPGVIDRKHIEVILASQLIVQIGLLMVLPMMMEIGLEKGFQTALSEFIFMHLQLAPVFFTFSLGTKAHYYGRTLLHGGVKYNRLTDHGILVSHSQFSDNYRLYSRSHFVKGFELMVLLLVYHIVGLPESNVLLILITASMWFMVGAWLFASFLFNPRGFEWQKIVDDWTNWNKWIGIRGSIGLPPEKSWESWWEEEHEHLSHSGKCGIVVEIILALRFFVYQYGLVYQLNITNSTKSSNLVYGASWIVMFLLLFAIKIISAARQRLVYRLIKGLFFVIFVSSLAVLSVLLHLTAKDVFVCLLAFMQMGWGVILIAQACKPIVQKAGFWGSVRTLARLYEATMGFLLITPVAILALFPFVSEIQDRILFSQAFSRFGRHEKERTSSGIKEL